MPALLYEKKGEIAYITLNRPEVHNALDAEVVVRLAEAWQDFADDDALRVAIITGAGDRAFSSGADLRKLIPLMSGARQPEDEWDQKLVADWRLTNIALLRGFDLYKPVIAAVNGFCLAGGTELIQATDIRIAAEHATFGLTEVTRAIIPAGGSMVRLPRQVPFCKAMEILLVGDHMTAEEAYRIGLVNRVVPAEKLMETAAEFAGKIAANGPLAVCKVKETVLKALGRPVEEGYALEDEAARVVMRSEDAREGPRAFAEKRPPRYVGR
ncbi:MAG: enoyl-CoA hydratase/isomerase family protein [Chloroflexi bacterium]|nr:enoyl-CoA hydratase/isomerase family protein [Chloroflexota bacterium]